MSADSSGNMMAMPRLRTVSPRTKGFSRRRAGAGWAFFDTAGARITDPDEVQRIKSLAIPPAWQEVWISPYPNGHIQAVGTDDAGRRQYLYHPDWRIKRDKMKFDRVLAGCPQAAGRTAGDQARPRARGDAAGAGRRGRRTAARPRLLPDRQRHLRRHQRVLRPDHAGEAARTKQGTRWSSSSSESPGSSTASRSTTPRSSRPWTACAGAGAAPRGCSPTSRSGAGPTWTPRR